MKYMGSKARFVKEILPIILRRRRKDQWYIEPFAGGMNVICNVRGNRIANDINYNLIQMWKKLIDGWIPKQYTYEEYKQIKNNKDKYPPYEIGWVGFCCSYRSKYFGGFAGIKKEKSGKIRNYQIEAIKNISKQIPKMKNVIFENKPYYKLKLPPKSIIYCDPPYKGTTKYNEKNFDYNFFWNWIRNIDKQGHTIFVSEYNAPSDFECVWKKKVISSLSVNGKAGSNKLSIEKLFKIKNMNKNFF